MLDGIHGKAGRHHHHTQDKNRGEKLLAFVRNNVCYNVERVIISVDAEEPQDSRHTEEPEGSGACREEHRQIVGEEGEKIDNPCSGYRVFRISPFPGIRIEAGGSVHPQHIVNCKKRHGNGFYCIQQGSVSACNPVKGSGKGSDQINHQHQGADHVIALVDRIIHHADRNHFKHFLPEGQWFRVTFLCQASPRLLSDSFRTTNTSYHNLCLLSIPQCTFSTLPEKSCYFFRRIV